MTNSADQQQHRTIINTPSDIIKGISRRAVLKGFVGAAGLMATGIGFTSAPLALATNTRQAASSSTAHPIGTTLYVFNDQFKGIYSVEWSPDGKRILTTGIGAIGDEDSNACAWDATTGKHIFVYSHSGGWYAAWSPDGTMVTTCSSDPDVKVYNATTGKVIYVYTGHTGYVDVVKWSPNGKLIASGGAGNDNDNTVQIFDAPSGGTL